MEQFKVRYWDKDGEPKEVIVEGDYGHDAAESIDDMGRLGWIEGLGAIDGDEPIDEPEDEGDESESDEDNDYESESDTSDTDE